MTYRATYPVPTCTECGIQSAGRCPSCRATLCMDHFARDEHAPCAKRLRKTEQQRHCYVCGVPVQPQQWSSTVFAHYIDNGRCAGCHRYVCDDLHTSVRVEDIKLVRVGLQNHRYHITRRYCALCAPLRRAGGLLGAAWWAVGVAGVVVASGLTWVEVFHHALHL